MSTMTYYQTTFGTGYGANIGIITLLIFLKLTQPPWSRAKVLLFWGGSS